MTKRTWIEFGIAMGIMAAGCGGSAEASPTTPPAEVAPAPADGRASLRGKIVNLQDLTKSVVITVNRGTDDGVAKGWKGAIVDESGKRLAAFEVLEVTARESVAKVVLPFDTVLANPNVVLEAP